MPWDQSQMRRRKWWSWLLSISLPSKLHNTRSENLFLCWGRRSRNVLRKSSHISAIKAPRSTKKTTDECSLSDTYRIRSNSQVEQRNEKPSWAIKSWPGACRNFKTGPKNIRQQEGRKENQTTFRPTAPGRDLPTDMPPAGDSEGFPPRALPPHSTHVTLKTPSYVVWANIVGYVENKEKLTPFSFLVESCLWTRVCFKGRNMFRCAAWRINTVCKIPPIIWVYFF